MRDIVFDSRAELVSITYKYNDRFLGVLITGPFLHFGFNRKCLDVEYETISMNTINYGGATFVEEAKEKAKEQTLSIIADIDKILTELSEHKKRLEDIDKLDLRDGEIRQERMI